MALFKINIQNSNTLQLKRIVVKYNSNKFRKGMYKVKKALIVVDYQNDFVDGSLGFEKAKLLEQPIIEKIKKYKKENFDIIFTFDTHTDNYLDTIEGKNLPIIHCVDNTKGWEIYGKVSDMFDIDNDIYFKKDTFGSLKLAQFLCEKNYEVVELVGLVSNICILSNAVLAKSALPQARIIVDAKCTASFDDDMNNKALDILEGIHIEVLNRVEGK